MRANARTSFYAFYRLVFPALAPEASFSDSLHFRVLARALEKVGTGTFPNSKYADQVDSMVQFLTHLDHRLRWTINLTAFRDHPEQPF